ncbi:hypothetical protein Rumeso_04914 [Rubellimicrobium mesophilum DSM 19309]|uniref:Phasin domain-containing protein n=1 Tax=Rubellimicrobium mesophilum DSM 19309 TaxID=442562 RepID=A0A017HBK5_9RHOB|nr:hypothetical protein [Rubellimicrobium mesophilum]EYD71513.1 hypothetical protein Rumeso_04914 [Rubellimicrobium mesophilum DSM 19309]
MTAANDAWAELMKASFGLVRTGMQVSEMMVASGSVIGARMTIMGHAARRPTEGNYAEITGMVAEKVVAVSRVNETLADQWSAMLLDTFEQARHFCDQALSGRPLSTGDCSAMSERWVAHGTRMMTRTMQTGGLALAPVHQQATANARRLS